MRISDWSSDVCSSDLAQRQILRDAISTSSMAPQDERSFLIMPLYHNDDQAMLKDSVAPFVAEQAPVSHLRSLPDSPHATGFSRDLWAQFTELGRPGMPLPDAHGGLGLGPMHAGYGPEGIGRNLTPS